MRKLLAIFIIAGAAPAGAQNAPESLNVAMYAPAAAFPDSSARLAYMQGLAKAVQQKTGIPTSGKIYVRLGDLVAAKPDFAVIDGQCLAAHSPGQILASAVVGGETAQPWALYTRGGESLATLRGKKLVYVKTGCRDADFLDNAMLDGEVKTNTFFGALVDKPDVSAAVLTVRDYKAADAVFAPAPTARGLTKTYDAGPVPNPGFVAMKPFPAPLLEGVRDAVLSYGGGGGIDGWRAAAPGGYQALGGRMGARAKRPIFAAPDVVRPFEGDQDMLVVPASKYEQATVKTHFWEPEPLVGAE
jgi:hypothetical protein